MGWFRRVIQRGVWSLHEIFGGFTSFMCGCVRVSECLFYFLVKSLKYQINFKLKCKQMKSIRLLCTDSHANTLYSLSISSDSTNMLKVKWIFNSWTTLSLLFIVINKISTKKTKLGLINEWLFHGFFLFVIPQIDLVFLFLQMKFLHFVFFLLFRIEISMIYA